MTPHGKFTRNLAGLAVAALALAGCSSDDEAQQVETTPLEQLMTPDASQDQRAAGGATAMAMELGFDTVQLASQDGLEAVRADTAERTAAAQDLNVKPQACAPALEALDWSPMLADSQAVTRVDFSREAFQGAGSIEVAGLTEATGGSADAADDLAAHQRAVEQITTDCSSLTMMLADDSEPDWAALEYTFDAEAISTETGSGLRWQRYPTADPETNGTTALTLMTETDGYAIMVAFIGGNDIADEEFVDISEAILASAVAQLE